jgi:hypothetical protein
MKRLITVAGLATLALAAVACSSASGSTSQPGGSASSAAAAPASGGHFQAGDCITLGSGTTWYKVPCSSGGGYSKILAVVPAPADPHQDWSTCMAQPAYRSDPGVNNGMGQTTIAPDGVSMYCMATE